MPLINKNFLSQQFAQRLNQAMIRAGFVSTRSTAGVDVTRLAEITGYSTVICRKYLKGEAIPEATKLIEIAQALNVSPGWLLFGETDSRQSHTPGLIQLDKATLIYLLEKAVPLFHAQQSSIEVATFLAGLMEDVSQISVDSEQVKQIIDLAIFSISQFPR